MLFRSEDEKNEKKEDAKVQLDFGRGPTAPTPRRRPFASLADSVGPMTRAVLAYLPFILMGVMVLTGMAILAIGLRAPMHGIGHTQRLEEVATRQQLLGRMRMINGTHRSRGKRRRVRTSDAMLALRLPGGYNCRGYCWLAAARIEAIFDTGASRNSIDKALLTELLKTPETQHIVKDIVRIEPLRCQSVSRSHVITIRQLAILSITFKECSHGKTETRDIGFCVLENSSESILFGKPTLDQLGFVSDSEIIELQTLDIKFPLVRHRDQEDGTLADPIQSCLRLADALHVEPRAGRCESRRVELVTTQECVDRQMWVEAGPDCPPEIEVVEGPVVARDGRCVIELLADGPALLGPATRLAQVRRMTARDEEILKGVRQAEQHHTSTHAQLLSCRMEAEEAARSPLARDRLLKASYKTRGKKERQEALFPELQAEIAAARKKLKTGVVWPDQEAEEYKDEITRRAEPLVGEQLTPAQRVKFMERVVRAFSAVFWIQGCSAPRVAGFEADIQAKAGAQPKVIQPFPLSRFDQMRLELHEDMEVEEGKAYWVPHGTPAPWGSPSFVVDSDGKGLLGRPVRDYRWVNSQTVDAAWPSPSAEAALMRAQRGCIHTQLDAVWGFTQIALSEQAQELLTLVTRRGLLRPRVLYFGPKQGPAIFQSLMDRTFSGLRDKTNSEFASLFMDDVTIDTEGYDDDDDDSILERHIEHCELFLRAAVPRHIQFKLEKSQFAQRRINLLGFVIEDGRRKLCPKKVEALRRWPEPKGLEDLVSFRAFVNFVREYIPGLHTHERALRPYAKKGARFSDYRKDKAAQDAFQALKNGIYEDAALHSVEYTAAADPGSGRPLELYVDASDLAWGRTLAQRQEVGGAPRPIAVYSRSFTETEAAWSTFERELYAIREALAATDHLTKGFQVVVYTDHKNNLFTSSLLSNRRINKKLLRWSLDLEELGSKISRIWLKGTDNVLGDAPSRNPPDRDRLHRLPVPAGPVRRIIEQMFARPLEFDEELKELRRFQASLDGRDPAPTTARTGTTEDPTEDPPVESARADPTALMEEEATTASSPSPDPRLITEGAPPSPPPPESTRTSLAYSNSSDADDEDSNDVDSLVRFQVLCFETNGDDQRALRELFQDEGEVLSAVDWTKFDGVYPRKPLVQVLALTNKTTADPKSLQKRTELPVRVIHVPDEFPTSGTTGTYIIEYTNFHECHDMVWRKRIRYRYTAENHDEVAALVWHHVDRPRDEGSEEHGRGDITGEGPQKHHGDPQEGFTFKVYPARPSLRSSSGVEIWRPQSETTMAAREFCKNAEFVRSFASGVAVYRCPGHEGEVDILAEYPLIFGERPLQGRRLVEVFSGVPEQGGAALSRAWEAAGGVAIRYDNRIDPKHDFMNDEEFWIQELGSPADVYHFAPPCTTFSCAHTTPMVRTRTNPYGDGTDPATVEANRLVKKMAQLILELISGGACVLIENPMNSHFWELDSYLLLAGMDGWHFVRTDHCMYGAPYQKPQLWLSTCPGITRAASVCVHPRPHPERLTGERTRRSSPYPLGLTTRLVEGFIAILHSSPEQRFDDSAAKRSVNDYRYAMKKATMHKQKKEVLSNYLPCLDVGRRRLAVLRHGATTTEWEGPFPKTSRHTAGDEEFRLRWREEPPTDYLKADKQSASSTPPQSSGWAARRPSALAKEPTDVEPAEPQPPEAEGARPQRAVRVLVGPETEFERTDLKRLLRSDPDFKIGRAHV